MQLPLLLLVRAPQDDAQCATIVNFGMMYDKAWDCPGGLMPPCNGAFGIGKEGGVGDPIFCCPK